MKKLIAIAIAILVLCSLVSCGHEHEFSEWEIVKEPTCEEAGLKTRSCECGEVEEQEIPALGHTPVVDEAVEPTCEETGLTEGKHCSVCNAVLEKQNEIPALGHIYENGKCTRCGMTDPSIQKDYDKAVQYFTDGNFTQAKSLFTQLKNKYDFKNSEKYLTAIPKLEKIKGNWKGNVNNISDYNFFLGTAYIEFCAPFSIGESYYGDCDWAAYATIKIRGSVVGKGTIDEPTFLFKNGFHHVATDAPSKLDGDMILIRNQSAFKSLFPSKGGIYTEFVFDFKNANSIIFAEDYYGGDFSTWYGRYQTTLKKTN